MKRRLNHGWLNPLARLAILISLSASPGAPAAPAANQRTAHYVPADKQYDSQRIAGLYEKGERKAYAGRELIHIAMPCGGVGAGELNIRGDGQLATWCIFNEVQFGMYDGARYLQPRIEEKRLEHGFAISVKAPGQPARVLRLSQADFDDLRFIGEYPIATLEYQRRARDLPVGIRGEVFSPLVPLSLRDSANPVTILSYAVTNQSDQPVEVSLAGWLENSALPGARAICHPGGSFGGFTCDCLQHPAAYAAVRRNRLVRGTGLTSMLLEVCEAPPAKSERPPRAPILIDNFERETWGPGWHAEGEAFGTGPLRVGSVPFNLPLQNHQGTRLATSFHAESRENLEGRLVSDPFRIERRHMIFRIGGGAHPGRTCLNLLIDGRVVRSETGANANTLQEKSWDLGEWEGREAVLEMVDRQKGGWGFILVDDLRLADEAPPRPPLDRAHPHFGDLAISLLDGRATGSAAWTSAEDFLKAWAHGDTPPVESRDHPLESRPCGTVISAPLTLAPGQSGTFTFVVSWHFPNAFNRSPGCPGRVGHIYNNWQKDSREAAAWVAANYERLSRQTHQFRDAYFDTTLPYWLVQRLGMPASTLAADNVAIWENGRMYAFEGVAFCFGTCGHVQNFATAASRLFPELERSVRLLQDLGPAFDPDTGRVNFRGHDGPDPRAGHAYASDAQSGYVLKFYREHLMSPDRSFLDRTWPQVRKIMGWQIFRDGAGRGLEPNGVLEDLQTFWDPMWFGPNPYNNTLYLAALRAAEEMARLEGEPALAERYRQIFESGRRFMNERMWNGEYYVHLYPEGLGRFDSDNGLIGDQQERALARQYLEAFAKGETHYHLSTGCDANQLFGQNWAHQLGLGDLLPPGRCRTAMQSVFLYNYTPDIRTVYSLYPPKNRTLAAPGEAALVNGSWPRPHLERQPFENIHDKEDVWTGLEYEAAADLIQAGLLTEALIVIRAIHDRYDGGKRNPWNEIEGWDHYSRAMHSWNCLLALGGCQYDGPAGRIGFAPRLKPEDFRCFFSGAEGWGSYRQQITTAFLAAEIAVQWGSLRARTVVLEAPAGVKIKSAGLDLAGRPVESEFHQAGRRLTVVLFRPETIKSGESIRVRLSW